MDYFLKFETEEEAEALLQQLFSKPLINVDEYHYGNGYVMKRIQIPTFEPQDIEGEVTMVHTGYEPGVHINLRSVAELGIPAQYKMNPTTPSEVFA